MKFKAGQIVRWLGATDYNLTYGGEYKVYSDEGVRFYIKDDKGEAHAFTYDWEEIGFFEPASEGQFNKSLAEMAWEIYKDRADGITPEHAFILAGAFLKYAKDCLNQKSKSKT